MEGAELFFDGMEGEGRFASPLEESQENAEANPTQQQALSKREYVKCECGKHVPSFGLPEDRNVRHPRCSLMLNCFIYAPHVASTLFPYAMQSRHAWRHWSYIPLPPSRGTLGLCCRAPVKVPLSNPVMHQVVLQLPNKAARSSQHLPD